MIENQQAMTNVYIPQLKAVAPNSGSYLSEVRLFAAHPNTSVTLTVSFAFFDRPIFVNQTGRRLSTEITILPLDKLKPNTILKIFFMRLPRWVQMSGMCQLQGDSAGSKSQKVALLVHIRTKGLFRRRPFLRIKHSSTSFGSARR